MLGASDHPAAAEHGDVGLANLQRDARIREALAELPQDYRDVVFAHYHLDLGLQEIADRFDLTESAVRSRLHRARTRLRGILEGTPVAAEAIEEARPMSSPAVPMNAPVLAPAPAVMSQAPRAPRNGELERRRGSPARGADQRRCKQSVSS